VLDWDSTDPNKRPEELVSSDTFFGKLADKATGHSARQAAIELNLHRTNWYKEVASRMEAAGITEPKAYTELRKTIEQFTQRGTLGQGKVPLFFSMRAMSGRIQQAWRGVAALTRGVATGETLKTGAQQEAAKAFVSMVGANTAMLFGAYQVAQLAGADPEIEMDGKLPTLRIGAHHWDPWAGLNSPAKAMIGIIADTAKNPEGGAENLPQEALAATYNRGRKFLRGGFSPAAGFLADTMTKRDYLGQKYNLAEEVKSGRLAQQSLTPFIVDSIIEAAREGSPLEAVAIAGPAFLSTGVGSYLTSQNKATDLARELYQGRDYDDLRVVEQARVISQMSTEDQKRLKRDFNAEQKQRKEEAGFSDPFAVEAELYRRNPELDAANSLVNPGNPVHSIEAADRLLEAGVQGDVLPTGFKRAVNQDERSRQAWEYSKGPTDWFIHDAVPENAPGAIEYFANRKGGEVYRRPDGSLKTYNELAGDPKGNITSEIRDKILDKDPELHAWLIWWGERSLPKTAPSKLKAELGKIEEQYGANEYSPLMRSVREAIKATGQR